MNDKITVNYGKLFEAGRNMTSLKESFLRIRRAIEMERAVHADDRGAAADALEAKRADLLLEADEKIAKAEQAIDLIGTLHWELSALLPAQNDALDMEVDYGNAKAILDRFFAVAIQCLVYIYADPCTNPHLDIWVPDGKGGGYWAADEAKLDRERQNGYTMEGLEDALYRARQKAADQQAYAEGWFQSHVLAFVQRDAELALAIAQKHQTYSGKQPSAMKSASARAGKVRKITIPGFPGLEIDPETKTIDLETLNNYIRGQMLRGAWDTIKDIGMLFAESAEALKNNVVFLSTYAWGKPDMEAGLAAYAYYGNSLMALKGLVTDPVGSIKNIGAYYEDMYNREGLVYTVGTFLPDIVFGILTGGTGAAVKGGMTLARTGANASRLASGTRVVAGAVKGLRKNTFDLADIAKKRLKKVDDKLGARRKYTDVEIQEILEDCRGTGFKNHPLRIEYETKVSDLKYVGDDMLNSGQSEEHVARTLYQMRRDIGVEYKDMTPQPLRDYIYEINTERYGDPLGPSFEKLSETKSFDEIIISASKPNEDIDKLLSGFEDWLRRK